MIHFLLGFPLWIVIYLFGAHFDLYQAAALIALNPIVWATMVELGLRRFADRPEAPTTE